MKKETALSGAVKTLERPVVFMAGTRPEAIKLALLFKELSAQLVPSLFCALGQHAELLTTALNSFQICPDLVHQLMKPDQDLSYITSAVLIKAKEVFMKVKPSLVVVQGDTTTAMASSLAAFYLKIPVAHVEAGLRTSSILRPFPEELNRRVIALLAKAHFAPTKKAQKSLEREGVSKDSIFCLGNTVVDALKWMGKKIEKKEVVISRDLIETVDREKGLGRTILLLTAHRRESFGEGLISVFRAIRTALDEFSDLFILFPMHPNPEILKAVDGAGLAGSERVLFLPPLAYPDLVFALNASEIVATDSGGIQEEAACLNKKVIVLRTETDRPEAQFFLAGTDEKKILEGLREMIKMKTAIDQKMPYGDGNSVHRIACVLRNLWEKQQCAV